MADPNPEMHAFVDGLDMDDPDVDVVNAILRDIYDDYDWYPVYVSAPQNGFPYDLYDAIGHRTAEVDDEPVHYELYARGIDDG